MRRIIAIVGKTATGKDTVARHLQEKYGIEPIVSFTTRPKRENEVDGREHYFITGEKMNELISRPGQLLAYTKFPKTGYEYCATTEVLDKDRVYSYIIDPPGIEWLKAHRQDVSLSIIALDAPEEAIRSHALNRGDNPQAVEDRLDSEREIFDSFLNSMRSEVINNDQSVEQTLALVDERMKSFKMM